MSSNERSLTPQELTPLIQYIKASNTGRNDNFGAAVALSSDGNTLAVGAYGEGSNGTGVNSGAQADNSASGSGAVYLFRYSASTWAQEAYIKASNTEGYDRFGVVALSSDGNTLAVGRIARVQTVRGSILVLKRTIPQVALVRFISSVTVPLHGLRKPI